jgi:spore germination protein YaaH
LVGERQELDGEPILQALPGSGRFPSMPLRKGNALLLFATLAAAHGCTRLPKQNPSVISFWLAPIPGAAGGGAFLNAETSAQFEIGETIPIDTVTFRPATARPQYPPMLATSSGAMAQRFAVVTTFQGSRYHPETIRALGEDTIALASVAGAIAREANSRGDHSLLMDFQGLSQNDLTSLVTMIRTLSDSARRQIPGIRGVILPPGDTVAYPTRQISAVAPILVLRLYGEHRPGTGPGALASPEWINRQLGLRAVDIGVNRLMAELPIFGYQWQRDGSARVVSFADAMQIVSAEALTLRRDQPSGFLTATGRDGWTIWVPDAQSVERMIRVVTRAGISRVMLTGMDGADPDLWVRLPAIRR